MLVSQSVERSVGPSVRPSVGPSVADYVAHATYGNWSFFFFNRSGKVNDEYDDKNLGHNDHMNDDNDDDADALADLKV